MIALIRDDRQQWRELAAEGCRFMRPPMGMKRLWFTKNGADIIDGIELRNGKANPFGWSQYEVWLREQAGEDYVEYQK